MTQPERKYRAGQMTVTVWKQKTEKNNEEKEFLTYTFTKQYKDGEEWKESKSLTQQDLLKAATLLQKVAMEETVKKE